jgi:hypothetical protein
MNELTNTTKIFLKRFEESLNNGLPNKKQCEKLIGAIENNLYELSQKEKIIIIYDLRQLMR